jgi:hypothetical protein
MDRWFGYGSARGSTMPIFSGKHNEQTGGVVPLGVHYDALRPVCLAYKPPTSSTFPTSTFLQNKLAPATTDC